MNQASFVPDPDHAEQRRLPASLVEKLAQVCTVAEAMHQEVVAGLLPKLADHHRLQELLGDVEVRAFRSLVAKDLLE